MSTSDTHSSPSLSTWQTIRQGWVHFWFAARSPLALHTIRILFGIILLCWLLPLAGYIDDFYGFNGWIDRSAMTDAEKAGGRLFDPDSWSLIFAVADNPTLLHSFYWGSVAIICCFTLGLFTRITGVLCWLIVVSFTENPFIMIDTDIFFRLIAFYLMIGYLLLDVLNDRLPMWVRLVSPWNHSVAQLLKPTIYDERSSAATTALRLLQVHFALALLMMGLHKLQIGDWWSGVAFWYPMYRPSTTTVEQLNTLRNSAGFYLNFISISSYLVIAWQIFFPTFAWRTGLLRWIFGLGLLFGTIGLVIIYSIPLLAPTFLLLGLCYLTDEEWRILFSPLWRLWKR